MYPMYLNFKTQFLLLFSILKQTHTFYEAFRLKQNTDFSSILTWQALSQLEARHRSLLGNLQINFHSC